LIVLLMASPWVRAAVAPPGVSDSAVAAAHPLATAAGVEILEAGGNAFDAAVAVSAALAVVEPYGSGLGGGGFWLLHRAADGHEILLDGRERAPLAARRDLYLDSQGEVIPGASVDGPLAAGIPGLPAALAHLSRNYGVLPLKRSLAPAIRLARQGFEVNALYRRLAALRLEVLRASPAASAIFLQDGEVPGEGYAIKQPDLAETLMAVAVGGAAGFYQGSVGEKLLKAVRGAGGIWSQEDFDRYRVVERVPLEGRFFGMRLVSAPPPSSGGVALVTMLNMLAGYAPTELQGVRGKHLIVEAMRRAYRDRAQYLGDPDYVDMPLERLTHPMYAAGLRASLRSDRATPSRLLPGAHVSHGGSNTTHLSILDAKGNRVAATLSINYPFGSGFVAPGTGVLLNDEMDDFAAKPGVPNVYGLVGAEANAIAGGKRMLSSMSPTFLEQGDRIAILGTPGGSRIITMVLLAALEFYGGASAEEIVALPRFHHQYLPDELQFEPEALTQEEILQLEAMGHRVTPVTRPYGNLQLVLWDRKKNQVTAASDPRGLGSAQVLVSHENR
jgi:gamma-glutamyltranspeptidase/glutathione hydrolase